MLLKTAEECFERFGLHRVTMDEIAAAARISRPTLYRYFCDFDKLHRLAGKWRFRMLSVDEIEGLLDRVADAERRAIRAELELKLITGRVRP